MIEYPDVFISHSHEDVDAVRALIRRWKSWDLTLYADCLDEELSRARTMTPALADHLRTKIRESRLFVFVVSQSSITSGWMPWELGFAHGAVSRVHVYLLDEEAEQAYATREYMQLYPRFTAANAREYLTAEVAAARRASVTPAQVEDGLQLGMRFVRAMEQSQVPDLLREAAAPADLFAATAKGMQIRSALGKAHEAFADLRAVDLPGLVRRTTTLTAGLPRDPTAVTRNLTTELHRPFPET